MVQFSPKPVRLLVVDDSALMREILTTIFSADKGVEVVGVANDPMHARELIKQTNPDVITLDVEMPKMDGLSFLEKIMRLRPMPVVMVSSLTQRNADVTLRALEMGAVDFVAKPTIDMQRGMEQKSDELIMKVKMAALVKVRARTNPGAPVSSPLVVQPGPGYSSTEKTVAIGSSTGGVEALTELVKALPADCPATLVVQHMPGGFTKRFSERLNEIVAVSVMEAEDGVRAVPGHVYIANGEKHLELVRSGAMYKCKLTDGPLVTGHRPSVDVLFKSMALASGSNAVGVILTGMGKDGAKGLLEMRKAGAVTLGQDEATSIVYGMPKAAFELGAVQTQLPISQVASHIVQACRPA